MPLMKRVRKSIRGTSTTISASCSSQLWFPSWHQRWKEESILFPVVTLFGCKRMKQCQWQDSINEDAVMTTLVIIWVLILLNYNIINTHVNQKMKEEAEKQRLFTLLFFPQSMGRSTEVIAAHFVLQIHQLWQQRNVIIHRVAHLCQI